MTLPPEVAAVLAGEARWALVHADNSEVLPLLPAESVDALVTDPPAGIGFMGKDWDGDKGGRVEWIAWLAGVMREALRVLKPGAHGLVWALPRTSHWTATALEDAGFEVRDVVMHLFGTGFPKSLTSKTGMPDGQGTALKPAAEHWILVRKPLAGTVAKNVAAYGTGGLNIDGCRIGVPDTDPNKRGNRGLGRSSAGFQSGEYVGGSLESQVKETQQHEGRWPAHVVLSHAPDCAETFVARDSSIEKESPENSLCYGCADYCAVAHLDAQSGFLAGAGNARATVPKRTGSKDAGVGDFLGESLRPQPAKLDAGGYASRFFYTAKPDGPERDVGCNAVAPKSGGAATGRKDGTPGVANPRAGAGRGGGRRNSHPTVKPISLMQWLCRLVTPPGGVVLDPFAGSGTSGVAAILEGFRFVGVELEEAYAEIATGRIAAASPGQSVDEYVSGQRALFGANP